MRAKPVPPKGPWKKGQSGNPAGRAKGTINYSTRLRRLIDVEPILKRLQAAAIGGDVAAARTLLERALPVRRATADPVELPGLNSANDLTAKARAVLDAVGEGNMPPDLGAQLVSAIGNVARVAEVDELVRRVDALEKEHAKKPV